MFRASQEIRSELYRMDMDAFAYRPPIEIIKGDLEAKMQEGVLRAVQKFDVNVDEEELRKALTYDRAQYEKGYADAMRFATDTNVGGKWIPVTERLPEEGGRYLCYVKSFAFKGAFYTTIMHYDKYGFVEGNIYTDDVTHWMPLPPDPEEE